MATVRNFGRNVEFRPREFASPASEQELLGILEATRNGRIRVVGARHAWSDAIVSGDVLVDMRHFNHVEINEDSDAPTVTVGGGCQVKRLLKELNRRGLTLPSVGLITEQTIAGATATGTHGSGRHSLSHYLTAVRLACYRPDGSPAMVDVTEGDELRAARCSLGCMGIVASVKLPCVRQYQIEERATPCATIDDALAREESSPLQQFFLFPHLWQYFAQERRVAETPRSWSAPLYRAYWFCGLDFGMHVAIKGTAAWLRSRPLVRLLFRSLLPRCIFPGWCVVDRSDRMLVMEHELFRHLELEAFVPDRHIRAAARFVEVLLKRADGEDASLEADQLRQLDEAGLGHAFRELRGRYTHHYPVCFRKILRDDTLLSMASGEADAWYSISFITYVEPRDDFYAFAELIAGSVVALFGGRIHWGKWFPLDRRAIETMYPDIEQFRNVARNFDPHGVFRNRFTDRVL